MPERLMRDPAMAHFRADLQNLSLFGIWHNENCQEFKSQDSTAHTKTLIKL